MTAHASGSLPIRTLGTTGLQVTPLSVGCAPLASMEDTFGYSVSQEQALATIHAALAGPINFLDTAASYGDGESERLIGLALAEQGGLPNNVVLATKADRDPKTNDFGGDQTKRSVERSLRLLGLERLQLVYIHDPEHVPFEMIMGPGGALEALLDMKQQGLIEHIGMAGGPIDLMIRYIETGSFEAVITHNRYTLLNRSAEPLLERATELGVAVVNAAPYGSGMLAKGPSNYPRYAYQEADPVLLERAYKLEAISQRHQVPLGAIALQFSIRDPRIASTIVGMTKPERIEQTIAWAAEIIPDEVWQEISEVPFDSADPEAQRF